MASLHQITRNRAQADPLWFIENILGSKPWQAQKDIIQAIPKHKEVAIASCHGIGKSWVAARIALTYLFTHPRSYVITTAPTGRQVKDILWQEIGMAYGGSIKPLGGELLTTQLKVEPGWFATGFATYDANAFQGRHAASGDILIIADEASGIESDIWVGIQGLMSSEGSRLLAIGNPTDPTGEFAKMFERPGVFKMNIAAFDTPNFTTFGITLDDIRSGAWQEKVTGEMPRGYLTDPAWVADKLERWGEDSPLWKSRVLGEFPDLGDDVLIPLSWVQKSMNRWQGYPEGRPTVAGMDIARFGNDRSCIAIRRGHKIDKLQVYNKLDLMTLTGALISTIREKGIQRAYVDEPGMGGGVIDRAKERKLGKIVIGISTGDQATDSERFLNLRAELWWTLREHLNPDQAANKNYLVLPPDEELLADLTAPKYKYTSRGQIQVESKEDMKKRGKRSTDLADAVCLAIIGAWRYKPQVKVPDQAVSFGNEALDEANSYIRT